MIRNVEEKDYNVIVSIYNYYIKNSTITFEEEPLTSNDIGERIFNITQSFPWIVFEKAGNVLGYAYASRFKERSAYRFSVETTIYLDHKYHNQGIGQKLYTDLITRVKKLGLKVIYGCIALPNQSSVRLHEKFGFKKVAHLTSVGYKFKQWIDVEYWELLLK